MLKVLQWSRTSLGLQDAQVVESLRVGSVPVRGVERRGAARERDASPLEGSLRRLKDAAQGFPSSHSSNGVIYLRLRRESCA